MVLSVAWTFHFVWALSLVWFGPFLPHFAHVGRLLQASLSLYYVCHGTWLSPWFRDYFMHFQIVILSTPNVTTLCLKFTQMGDDTIYPELLLAVEVVCWNKLPGCWQLKDQKTLLTINNYLSKYNGVTIINTIYLLREIVTFVVFER